MTETAMDRVRRALEAATDFHPNGTGNWRCPAHDDNQASLSVTQKGDKVVLHCHANCPTEEVLRAIGLNMADLFDKPLERQPGADIVATYDYVDEDGRLLFQVVRKVGKKFSQRRPRDGGGWIPRLEDTRRVVYRLPRVIEAVKRGHIVYVVEGEKDVHALEGANVTATCNPGGAGKWRDEYSRHFTGAKVRIVADRDEPGRAHANQVAAALHGVATEVKILEPAEGKDAADHLAAGLGVDAFVDPGPGPVLPFVSAAELVRLVDEAPPTPWLARPVWPADAYGVMAAEQKAGKTWALLDLAVSVASGTPWLGLYPVERQGPVLLFLGEGGRRKMKRRLDAICYAKGVSLAELPIEFCFRVPHLSAVVHLGELAEKVKAAKPVMVGLDPLYLAARGAKASQLVEMGEHLENVQVICQQGDAALVIVHHWNKTGEGKGAKRFSGAGGAEWGRVLISVSVRSKRTEPETKETAVVLDLIFEGDEIPDTETRIRRRVWSEDPEDLSAMLHYDVDAIESDDEQDDADPEGAALKPSSRRVLAVLEAVRPEWTTVASIGDVLATQGRPLKKRTIQGALKELKAAGLAEGSGDTGDAWSWRATRPGEGPESGSEEESGDGGSEPDRDTGRAVAEGDGEVF